MSGDTFRTDNDSFFKETGAIRLNKPCGYDEIVGAVEQLFSGVE